MVNATVSKPKQLGHRPSVNGAKYSHNDTVSTHNRFQVPNLHTDDIEVLFQNTFPSDTSVNSVSSSPSSTHVSTKVGKVCNVMRKNYRNFSSSDDPHSGEVIIAVSDVGKEENSAIVPNKDVNALTNTDHHVFAGSHLDPPLSNVGFVPTCEHTAIPLPVWENRIHCTDYNRCVAQNGNVFGALPITDQIVYRGLPTNNAPVTNILELHSKIRHSQLPNFWGCRIPVQGQLNSHVWREYLSDYWDKQLPDLINYGFPIDFDRTCPLLSTDNNHSSAQQFPKDIEIYLDNEVAYNAMYGPFTDKPIDMHISPLMTREKPGSDNRRTIVDLSWPYGCSVNHGVAKINIYKLIITCPIPLWIIFLIISNAWALVLLSIK